MGVRFKRNIRRAAFCSFTGLFKGDQFGMRHIIVTVSSLANNLAIGGNDDTTYKWIWRNETDARRRKFKGFSGKDMIDCMLVRQ